METLAHNTLRGEVSLETYRRPSMKLSNKPRIVACIPVGTKSQRHLFEVEGQKWMTRAAALPGVVPVQWVSAQMGLVAPLGTLVAYLFQWGMLSGEARQIMTMRALDMVQEDGYILYWDDDSIVEPLSLYTLYSYMEQHPEVGATSGVYSTRQDPTEPVVYKEHMKGAHWGVTVGPNAVPEEVFGVGAGFLLARASVVRKMVADNPGVPIWADSKERVMEKLPHSQAESFNVNWGHDIRFCRLMRESGYPVMVDGRVEIGHFDAESQRIFKLPDDSAPKMRGRGAVQVAEDNSICLILPTYGHLAYAEKAARSFLENTKGARPVICAVDDATPGLTNEDFAEWAANLGIQHAHRFEENDGLTRSWNYGLQWARANGMRYAVCGNSDLIFSPGWDVGIIEALKDYDLVGPVTNAAGWGTETQRVENHLDVDYAPDDSWDSIAATAERLRLAGMPAQGLTGPLTSFVNGVTITVPEYLNGFCLVAKTETWIAGGYDRDHVFDPANKMTENEVELQTRWVVGQGGRRAVVPSSFVFHYRSVSRGDQYKCEGAYRAVNDVAPATT